VKLVLEILVSLLLHPLAFILAIIDIVRRDDLSGPKKLIWAVISIAWGIGPILYIVLADGKLW
jgi:hypothetical protein